MPFVTAADSVAELANKANLPALVATVDRYNHLVEAGEDADFGKAASDLHHVGNGKVYAVELGVGAACAIGGLQVNNAGEVLDEAGHPVKGLYAAGNDAAGMLVGDTYAPTLPGSTAGYAAFSGRNAVINMAEN